MSFIPKEIWRDRPGSYWEANDGWGMCNTGSGLEIICSFGGIGCNVDHAFVKARNLDNMIKDWFGKSEKISGGIMYSSTPCSCDCKSE